MDDKVKNLIYPYDEKKERLKSKSKAYLTNPFIRRDGSLANPYIDYQRVLRDGRVSSAVARKITEATGFTPSSVNNVRKSNETVAGLPRKTDSMNDNSPPGKTLVEGNPSIKSMVGKRIANTSTYNNSAVKGQCVWYARGRAKEKLGVNLGSMGNANQMWQNAMPEARVSAKAENLRPNMLVTYQTGVSNAGRPYGHVIFIEDRVGDTVYYTEGGSSYYKNGTDGVVKTATVQDIMNGVNSSGNRVGYGVIGFIDLNKYR